MVRGLIFKKASNCQQWKWEGHGETLRFKILQKYNAKCVSWLQLVGMYYLIPEVFILFYFIFFYVHL